ncbi:MAG TPA: FeoA domain-containing protein [Candidatus Dormibacteraeota bacterium]|nr:FeoA domain-containing protein [Candidatus Dormibacteraeota bacterium]
MSLAELTADGVAPIARLSEVAEHQAPQLRRLRGREGLRLGELVSIRGSPGADAVTVIRGDRQTALGMGAARAVWVDLSPSLAAARKDHGVL